MAANICSTSSGRLFVIDRYSEQPYLVDTGSDLCVFPRKLLPGRRERTDYTLYAANGTTIPTYCWTSKSLKQGRRREITWRFVIADVDLPILVMILLSHYGLLVDCRNNRLLDGVHVLSHHTAISPQCQNHRWRHATRQPPGGIPGADQASRDTPRGPGTKQHITSVQPPTHLLSTARHQNAWPSPRPSSTPCCGTAPPDAQKAHGLPPPILCQRRKTVGGPVETTGP